MSYKVIRINAYRDCRIALSDKGWTNDYIGLQWFERSFVPQAMKRNKSGRAILLIYDGHHSHDNIQLREAAMKHNINLFCLHPTPHTGSNHLTLVYLVLCNACGKVGASLPWRK